MLKYPPPSSQTIVEHVIQTLQALRLRQRCSWGLKPLLRAEQYAGDMNCDRICCNTAGLLLGSVTAKYNTIQFIDIASDLATKKLR